jgi:hypothetical protein
MDFESARYTGIQSAPTARPEAVRGFPSALVNGVKMDMVNEPLSGGKFGFVGKRLL